MLVKEGTHLLLGEPQAVQGLVVFCQRLLPCFAMAFTVVDPTSMPTRYDVRAIVDSSCMGQPFRLLARVRTWCAGEDRWRLRSSSTQKRMQRVVLKIAVSALWTPDARITTSLRDGRDAGAGKAAALALNVGIVPEASTVAVVAVLGRAW